MSGEFDVFDEWGAYVGRFTPAGGGWEGCLFAIALLLLWTVGFLVYLVIKGFKEAAAGKWGKAMVYWAAPLFLVLVQVISTTSDSVRFQSLCEKTRVEVNGREIFVYAAEGYGKAYDVRLKVNGFEVEVLAGNRVIWPAPIEEVVLAWIWEYMGSPLDTRSVTCGRVVYPLPQKE